MEITCEHCKAKLNIPDGKIPRDQVVKINCPKCKNRITLDHREAESPASSPAQPAAPVEGEAKTGRKPEGEGYGYADFSDDAALDFFEEGVKLALVMDGDPDRAAAIKEALGGLGYRCVLTPNTRDAIGKMRFHHFDLLMLAEGFDGQALDHSPILNYLNHASMSVRRRVFLALLGDRFKTLDNMMSFALSANVVINTGDLQNLPAILKRALSESEKFYKVFMDTLAETGKA